MNDDELLVHADRLQAEGDPRGELIVVQHSLALRPEDATLRARERELILLARKATYDAKAYVARWRLGFVDDIHLTSVTLKNLPVLLRLPEMQRVREVTIAHANRALEIVAKSAAPTLRMLRIMHARTVVTTAHLERIAKVLPRLEGIGLTGLDESTSLAPLAGLPLRELEVPFRNLDLSLEWPLERLRLVFERGETDLGVLAPLLEGRAFPRLQHLELVRPSFTASLVAELPRTPLFARLRVFGFSADVLGEAGTASMVAQRDAYAKVALIPPRQDPWSVQPLADLLLELGRAEEAIPLYREALERASGSMAPWLGLGAALAEVGRHEEALAAFDTCAVRSGQFPSPELVRRRELTLQKLGRT